MKSKTSTFSLPFFGNTLRRFMPFTILYTVIIALSGPVSTAYTLTTRYANIPDLEKVKTSGYYSYLLGSEFTQYNHFGAIRSIPWIFAVILAVLLFNYLHKKNALDLYHSIPLKRESIFITYSILGFVVLAVPMLLTFVANMIVLSTYKIPELLNPLAYLSNVSIEILLMFAIFLMVIFISFISDSVANNALLAMYLFSISFAFIIVTSGFLYNELFGYSSGVVIKNAYRFTPFLRATVPSLLSFNWVDIVFFAALALTLFFLIILFYKKRKTEAAGKGFGFVSSFFCWTAAYLGAICGYLLSYSSGRTGWKIFWYIVGGTISWVVSNVIINKGFKKLLPTWKQFIILQLAVGLLFSCVKFDFVGFEKRVPSENNVSQVTFNYSWNMEGYSELSNSYSSFMKNNPLLLLNNYSNDSSYLISMYSFFISDYFNYNTAKNNFTYKDPQNIKLITQLHKKIIEAYKAKGMTNFPAAKNGVLFNNTQGNPVGIIIDYKLKPCFSMSRTYIYSENEIKNLLIPLFNSQEYKKQAFDIFKNNANNSYVKATVQYDNYSLNNSTGGTKSKEVINKLLEEIKKDLLSFDYNTLLKGAKPIYSISLFKENEEKGIISKRLPVYDSFTNTKRFLKDNRIISNDILPLSEVTSIDVTGDSNQNLNKTIFPFSLTDRNQIGELYNDIIRLSQKYTNYICIDVNYKNGSYSNVMINLDYAPKWFVDKIHYTPQLTYSSYSSSAPVKVSSSYVSSSSSLSTSSASYIYASKPSSSSRPSTSLQTIDDTVTGTALGQFNFSGSWSKAGQINSTDQAGYYEFKFVGTYFEIFANKDVAYGLSKVEVDGNTVKTIDQYAPIQIDNFPLYISNYNSLSYGEHTVRVTNLMQKSSKSKGTFISVDYIRYR